MAFFGPLWGRLLDEGKAKLRLHLATEDPFPPREMAINGICSEIIVELVIRYEEEGLELESGRMFHSSSVQVCLLISIIGFYPQYAREMAIILSLFFGDTPVDTHSLAALFRHPEFS